MEGEVMMPQPKAAFWNRFLSAILECSDFLDIPFSARPTWTYGAMIFHRDTMSLGTIAGMLFSHPWWREFYPLLYTGE